jgi:hypothetical protein
VTDRARKALDELRAALVRLDAGGYVDGPRAPWSEVWRALAALEWELGAAPRSLGRVERPPPPPPVRREVPAFEGMRLARVAPRSRPRVAKAKPEAEAPPTEFVRALERTPPK